MTSKHMEITEENIDEQIMLMTRIAIGMEEVGECWEWQGATGKSGHPVIHARCSIDGLQQKGCSLVRRLVFALHGGNLVPRKPIGSRCNNMLCVNPAHLFLSSIKEVAKKAAMDGAWTGKARSMKISKKKRENAKLNMEIANEIRISDEKSKILAERYGVNKSLINSIRAGKVWRDYSSPFAGLGARA